MFELALPWILGASLNPIKTGAAAMMIHTLAIKKGRKPDVPVLASKSGPEAKPRDKTVAYMPIKKPRCFDGAKALIQNSERMKADVVAP